MTPRSKNFRARGLGKLPQVRKEADVPKKVFRARALVRVVLVERTKMMICVPGWNHRSRFWVKKSIFPRFKFEPGYRFHANINLAARNCGELAFLAPFEKGSTRVPTWEQLIADGIVQVTQTVPVVVKENT